MFKKYHIDYTSRNHRRSIDFYVNFKRLRSGNQIHRAIAVGDIPRLDGTKADLARYDANGWKLEKARRMRTEARLGVERWAGQNCLCKLWRKLASMSFVDMCEISIQCPFASDQEPEHEDIVEADELFAEGGVDED